MATTRSIFIAGQSFAEALLAAGAKTRIRQAAARVGGNMTLAITGYAVGGTSALKRHQRTDIPNLYWFNEDTGKPGPLLVNAIAAIKAQIAIGNTPTDILWLQAQQDTVYVKDEATADLWKLATQIILLELRKAISPTAPYNILALIEPTTRRVGPWPNPLGIDLLRQRQVELVSSGTGITWLAEIYDCQLLGDVDGGNNSHLTTAGLLRFCDRVGARCARLSGRYMSPLGPALSSPALSTDKMSITVNVVPEAGSTIMAASLGSPCGFGVKDAEGNIDIGSISSTPVAGGVYRLTISLARQASGAVTLIYPYGSVQPFEPSRVIRYSTTDRPLRTAGTLSVQNS